MSEGYKNLYTNENLPSPDDSETLDIPSYLRREEYKRKIKYEAWKNNGRIISLISDEELSSAVFKNKDKTNEGQELTEKDNNFIQEWVSFLNDILEGIWENNMTKKTLVEKQVLDFIKNFKQWRPTVANIKTALSTLSIYMPELKNKKAIRSVEDIQKLRVNLFDNRSN